MVRGSVGVVVMVALLLAPCASADIRAQQLELKTGPVAVTVQNHDGKALAAATLKVSGADGKLVRSLVTDKQGKCTLDGLKPGAYKVVVAERAVVKFAVSDKAKVARLLVMLPPPAKYAAGEGKKAITMPTLLTFIIGGAAVAGLIIAIASGGGGGGGHP